MWPHVFESPKQTIVFNARDATAVDDAGRLSAARA